MRRPSRALRSPPRAQPAPLREGGEREEPGGVLRSPPVPRPSVPRPAPSPPDARSAAGSLRTSRVAECQPSPRSESGCLRVRPSLRVSFPTRRSGGNAEVPASASRRPAGRAGLVYGPFWPIPLPAPHGSFHQNLRIFFLRFQHFIFLFCLIPHGVLPQPRFARQPPLGGGRSGSGRHRGTSPSTRSERAASAFGQVSAFLFQRGDPAATRRCPQPLRAAWQKGPASASRRPAERAGLAYGPFWPIPPPGPHGPFHQNLRIFFLRFQ